MSGLGTVILGIESSCDETAAAVVTRRGDQPASSLRRQTCMRPTAASSPSSRRAGTCAVSPVVREALAQADAFTRRLRRRRRDAGPGPDRRAPGRVAAAKALAWARISRSCRSTTSTATFLALPAAGTAEPPFLALLASGGHTMLVDVARHVRSASRHDARRRRGRGIRQGRAAPRPRLPRRPRARPARPRRRPHRLRLPVARVPGLDFSFSGLKTSLLYVTREALTGGGRTAPGRPRRDLRARDRARARRARPEAAKEVDARQIAVVVGVAANSLSSGPRSRTRPSRRSSSRPTTP